MLRMYTENILTQRKDIDYRTKLYEAERLKLEVTSHQQVTTTFPFYIL